MKVDPLGMKQKLSEYGNNLLDELWMTNGCPKNIIIASQPLDCSGELRESRFGKPSDKSFDGIHMRGRLAVQHYTASLINVFLDALSGQVSKKIILDQQQSNFVQKKQHKPMPNSGQQQKPIFKLGQQQHKPAFNLGQQQKPMFNFGQQQELPNFNFTQTFADVLKRAIISPPQFNFVPGVTQPRPTPGSDQCGNVGSNYQGIKQGPVLIGGAWFAADQQMGQAAQYSRSGLSNQGWARNNTASAQGNKHLYNVETSNRFTASGN